MESRKISLGENQLGEREKNLPNSLTRFEMDSSLVWAALEFPTHTRCPGRASTQAHLDNRLSRQQVALFLG